MRRALRGLAAAGTVLAGVAWSVVGTLPEADGAEAAAGTLVVRESVSQSFRRTGRGGDVAYAIRDRRSVTATFELEVDPAAIAAFDASTAVQLRVGALRVDAVLGDDPQWTPARRIARIAVPGAGAEPAGEVVLRWGSQHVSVRLRAARGALLTAVAPPEGRSAIEPPVDAAIALGDASWFFGGEAAGVARVRRIDVLGAPHDLVHGRARFSGEVDAVAGDRSAPAVAIVTPLPNSVVTAPPVAVSGTAADDREIVRVVWSIDGGVESDAAFAVDDPGSGPDGQRATWSFLVPPSGDALHRVRVRVLDRAGNETVQEVPFVTWQKAGPALAVGTANAWYAREGELLTWPAGSSTAPAVDPDWGEAIAVATGFGHTLVALADGSVRAAGSNPYGVLGDGTSEARTDPAPVVGLSGVVSVAAGSMHSMALRGDGTVWVWGQNEFGQLGDGTQDAPNSYLAHPVPQQVPGIADAVAIRAGNASCFAILADGKLRVWGGGYLGRAAGTTPVLSPTAPDGDDSYVEVAAGGNHTLARRADGTVWAWGNASYGAIGGVAVQAERLTPQQVEGITNAVRVTASLYGSAAVIADGTLLTWGYNNFGTDANPLRQDHATPTPVAGVTDVIQIAGGYRTQVILALQQDGTLLGWGSQNRIATTPTVIPLP